MKYFAEVLATLFVILSVILVCIIYVAVIAAMQEGYLTNFAVAYALGFISPVLIYIQFIRMFAVASPSPVFNTALGNLRGFL